MTLNLSAIEHSHTNHADNLKRLDTHFIARRILHEFMRYRRTQQDDINCSATSCSFCYKPHFNKVIHAVEQNKPVTFVLPAFPGKSPNPKKVLGYLPDKAEKLALKFLDLLGTRIKTFYRPGIKIILCSDGRVFSDVVGMKDAHISAYQTELDKLIDDMALDTLSTFNLDQVFHDDDFYQMRERLMTTYGKTMEQLKKKIKNGTNHYAPEEDLVANRMYRGMTRFLFEDSLHAHQVMSKSALQKQARQKAYEVIQRSNAWSSLIEERFPHAVRLSIHPQVCGANKLGIRLIDKECWMTPWHGVAVETKQGFMLLKRAQAEARGAKLMILKNGQPSHYQLNDEVRYDH